GFVGSTATGQGDPKIIERLKRIRLLAKRGFEVGQRLARPAGLRERQAEVVVRLGISRTKRERAFEAGDGLGPSRFVLQELLAEIVVGHPAAGIAHERSAKERLVVSID